MIHLMIWSSMLCLSISDLDCITIYMPSFDFTISKLFPSSSSAVNPFTISFIVSELQYIFKCFFARVKSVYKELHADHETGATDNK